MSKECPHCHLTNPDTALKCDCGYVFATGRIDPPVDPAVAVSTAEPPTPAVSRVRIIDIDMPFTSMIGFMVKWALASIPALIILAILAAMAFGLFSGLR